VDLRYSGLLARDARGRTLHSWLGVAAGRLMIHVADRGERYPLHVDPLIQQGAKLTSNDAMGLSSLGYSVALSSNGNTLLIGGPYDNTSAGAAWVFTRSNGTWIQQGPKLVGNCASGCSGPKGTGEVGHGFFGRSVALSSDGNTAMIGGDGDNSNEGAAWVFTRSGSTWTQQGAKLTPNDGTGFDTFGDAVALSSDGNTALIGGVDSGGQTGAAWVFTRSGSTWSQQGSKLTPNGETGNGGFGGAVALSSDGNIALIGGSNDNGYVGAAWVFTRAGTSWSQQGSKLSPNDETGGGRVGYNVALSADGTTALIGGIGDNSYRGAAWVFARAGTSWQQQGSKLTPSNETGAGEFGIGVALSSTGATALIGADQDNSGAGAAWLFAHSGSTWSQQGTKFTPTGQSGDPNFGDSVALSADGNVALLGGEADAGGAGAAWVFATPQSLTVSRGGGGSGTVTSSPTGIACGPTCSASFPHGTPVTLTATPAAGSMFAGWSGACTGSGQCSVTMTTNQTVTATFTHVPPPVTHALTVSRSGSGSGIVTGPQISCPGKCTASYSTGTVVSLDATAAAGSVFTGWGGACAGTGPCTVTITADKAATATFRMLAPRISHARLTHPRFRVAARATALVASSSGRAAPLGTRFRFTLSTTANVTIAITRTVPGLRISRGCVAPTAKLRRAHAHPCRRKLTLGTLARRHEPQGADIVSFSGRIGRRPLSPGTYTAALTATNAGGKSNRVSLAFTVTR
jgi:hypothetical protein